MEYNKYFLFYKNSLKEADDEVKNEKLNHKALKDISFIMSLIPK